jgi:hypothetical protein
MVQNMFHALASFYHGICFEALETTNPAFFCSSNMGLFDQLVRSRWAALSASANTIFVLTKHFAVVDAGIGA